MTRRGRPPGPGLALVGTMLLIATVSFPCAATVAGPPACAEQDSRCPRPAVAPANGAAAVIYLPAPQVEAAFSKGEPLVEMENYKIHASRRDAPGLAEIHTRDTDIVHVLQGTALLVTGGRAVDAKPTAEEELRGSAIEGGNEQRIAPGDVVIIPNGVPHWFKEVQAPFLYYVVKVRDEGSGPGSDA